MNLLSSADKDLIQGWNRVVPRPVDRCLHDLVSEHARSRPDAPAVCAWDGDLTYGQLEAEASRFSRRLRRAGVVGLGAMVPLCFEKSKWAVVAMLAVLKAGAAFVPLDPSQAPDRRERVLVRTRARVVLVSARYSNLDVGAGRRVVVVDGDDNDNDNDDDPLSEHDEPGMAPQTPSSTAYVLFTSGSTGQPKGVVVSHRAISSSCYHHGLRMGHGPETRTLQFAAYTFDASCYDIFTTLVWGGVVATPSEDQRLGRLSEAMDAMKVNTAALTASVSRLIEPSRVPSFHTLTLAGEAPLMTDFTRWSHLPRVMNCFGPTETAIVSTIYDLDFSRPDASCIGTGAGAVTWVADPGDHQKLAAVGAVGELLVEGPILAQGYLDDPERTAAAFVEDPAWLLEAGRRGTVYKTGDLVRYHPDGTLAYLGRKDTQIKIRGQRVEVGETEHHLRECLPQMRQVAAEVIVPEGGAPMLAAFVVPGAGEADGEGGDGSNGEGVVTVCEISTAAADDLARRLPAYMIPSVYFRLDRIPTNVSFKTDRKKLRGIGASFSARRLADLRRRAARGDRRAPSNDVERELQRLWAVTLEIDEASSVGVDDDFFRLGGDSLSVMRLVGEAHRSGIALSVADVFKNPTIAGLGSLSNVRKLDSSVTPTKPARFSLVDRPIVDRIRDHLHETRGVAGDDVEDIMPVTLFQQEVLDRAARIPEQTFNYFFLDLGTKVDADALRRGCQLLTRHVPILRTLFIPLNGVHWQVVLARLDDTLLFNTVDVGGDIDDASREQSARSTQRGLEPDGDYYFTPFTSFTLLRHASGANRLMVRLSHAQYDGVCFPSIIASLIDAYRDRPLAPLVDFSVYLAHARQQEARSIAYWRRVLDGSSPTGLGRALRPGASSSPSTKPFRVEASRVIPAPRLPAGLTLATLLTSSWAAILARLTDSREVVFGRVVAGRNAGIPGVQDVMGPCVNTVPVRVSVPTSPLPDGTVATAESYLRGVQDQHVAMGEADSLGLADIIRHCTTWRTPGPAAAALDSVVEHSSLDTRPALDLDDGGGRVHWFEPDAVPERLVVTSALGGGEEEEEGRGTTLTVRVAGASDLLSREAAEAVVARLAEVMEGVAGHPRRPLSDVLGPSSVVW